MLAPRVTSSNRASSGATLHNRCLAKYLMTVALPTPRNHCLVNVLLHILVSTLESRLHVLPRALHLSHLLLHAQAICAL